ncbi:MAG: LysM peptidoglycan-binding domain-containing protein [Myxococcales bacterium]|nr:LysM peptidoglycan-binding domain-containing protein [Myxococcales bacterium]
MSHCKTIVFTLSAFSFVAAGVAGHGVSEAQPENLTIDTSTGTVPAPPEAAPVGAAPQGPPSSGEGEGGEAGDNRFYGDYLDGVDMEDTRTRDHGVVPRSHTVVTGDTLWDLSAYYFRNAWNWPKVWKLNPEIADPHWIYPGNIVRLREGGKLEPVPAINKGSGELAPQPLIVPSTGYGLRQHAYVDLKDLKHAGTVSGAVDEKSLLSVGDSIYLTYEGDKVPEVGTTLAVYGPGKKIKREGKAVGAYVEVAGELRITFASKDKRARAIVTRSIHSIERGMKTGPLELNFKRTKAVANTAKVNGEVVDLIGPDELIGAEAAVLIDRGSNDGVQVGNRFLVVRRGDAYQKTMKPGSSVGQEDEDYPARAIGEIIVVQTGKQACLGVVSFSIHEFGIGDRVFMRKGQ